MKTTNTLSAIVLGLALSFSGCSKAPLNNNGESILQAGRVYDNMIMEYDGMPSDSVFSVSEKGNGAVNIYYPARLKTFNFSGEIYQLVHLDPENLTVKKVNAN